MSQVRTLRKQRIDWIAFALFASLVAIGWLMIYAASHQPDTSREIFDLTTSIGKQSLFILIGAVVFAAIMFVDWKFWSTFAYPVFGFSMILLVLVLIIGNSIKGSTSWFSLGGFSLQPSEFAKFGTCLAMAAFLSYYRTNLKRVRHQAIAFAIFLAPAFLILLQPDAGSALVFMSFIFVLYREGLPPWLPLSACVLAALFICSLLFDPLSVVISMMWITAFIFILNFKKKQPWVIASIAVLTLTIAGFVFNLDIYVLIVVSVFLFVTLGRAYLQNSRRQVLILTPVLLLCVGFTYLGPFAFENMLRAHQQDRINAWLRPSQCDPTDELYNLLQSKIAIGSGGLEGKGFLNGTMTKLNYVPEQTTDFIFSTIGEEQGFIGSLAIIVLFLLLLMRIITMAERAKSNFVRQYAYGVAGIFFIHFFINIGMTMGLAPIIGIPLPFISYGGSSLLGSTIMISVLLRMDSSRWG